MNNTQLIEAVAGHTGVDKKTVATVVAGLGDVILASVTKGDTIVLRGVAKFTKTQRKARMGRNPATGAPIKIGAKKAATVRPLKLYKDTVLGVAPAPKLEKKVAAAPAKPAAKKPAAKKPAAKPAAKKPAAKKPAAKPAAKKPAA
ncbi:MAG: HU family DNA-binding protein, partial [Actinobacteria bacterium]|nr:HU family DNA-binding protein [Actinomycetota bacterium]